MRKTVRTFCWWCTLGMALLIAVMGAIASYASPVPGPGQLIPGAGDFDLWNEARRASPLAIIVLLMLIIDMRRSLTRKDETIELKDKLILDLHERTLKGLSDANVVTAQNVRVAGDLSTSIDGIERSLLMITARLKAE